MRSRRPRPSSSERSAPPARSVSRRSLVRCAGQARRSRRRVARRLAVFALGRSGGGGRVRRLARPRDCDLRGWGSALREGRNGLARADRRRAQREARHARRPAGRKAGGGSARVAESTMFFPRLRNQAKWAFVLLIVVFAGGFVFLGVGSGGLDLGQLLRDAFGNKSPSTGSISKAQD